MPMTLQDQPELIPGPRGGNLAVDPSQVWFVVRAYNESRVIGEVLALIKSSYPNFIVVDDGSNDATAEVAAAAGAHVVIHPINLGGGAALQTGLSYALRCNASYIVTFDADGQHDVADVGRMLQALREHEADIAIGSRFLVQTSNVPALRRLVLKVGIFITWLSSGIWLTDTHNGLRLMTREAARKLRLHQDRMAYASELIDQIAQHKLRYVEVPVTIRYTSYSMSKGQRNLDSIMILKDLIVERFFR